MSLRRCASSNATASVGGAGSATSAASNGVFSPSRMPSASCARESASVWFCTVVSVEARSCAARTASSRFPTPPARRDSENCSWARAVSRAWIELSSTRFWPITVRYARPARSATCLRVSSRTALAMSLLSLARAVATHARGAMIGTVSRRFALKVSCPAATVVPMLREASRRV